MSTQSITYYAADGSELVATFFSVPHKILAKFPEWKPTKSAGCYVGFRDLADWNSDKWEPVARRIEFKKNPSLHKCDARCRCARGGTCECSCGGKFHGVDA